jgi:hypothetical protein
MKRIAIWSHPRSRSTALERAFIEREDFDVMHEPFSMSKYKDESENEIYKSIVDYTNGEICEAIKKIIYKGKDTNSDNLIIKDFPYHSLPAFDALTYIGFEPIFLIRNPLETIHSWQRIHPEFEYYELGYKELYYSIKRVKDINGLMPTLIYSDDLVDYSEQVLKTICKKHGLDYRQEMVNWKKRESMPIWHAWSKYHVKAKVTNGFTKKPDNNNIKLTKRNYKFYRDVLPIYQEILQEFN